MKKLLTTTIVAAMITSLGAAWAQTSQSHDVEVRIPNVLMIRLTAGTGNAAVSSPTAVVFDLLGLGAADFEPVSVHSPTGTANWDNVRVFANGGGWRVTLATSTTTFDWSKVQITPSGGYYTVAPFTLATGEIFSHTARTGGWRSLGFGPAQFRLHLDGTEAAGNYSTTVTYTIATP